MEPLDLALIGAGAGLVAALIGALAGYGIARMSLDRQREDHEKLLLRDAWIDWSVSLDRYMQSSMSLQRHPGTPDQWAECKADYYVFSAATMRLLALEPLADRKRRIKELHDGLVYMGAAESARERFEDLAGHQREAVVLIEDAIGAGGWVLHAPPENPSPQLSEP